MGVVGGCNYKMASHEDEAEAEVAIGACSYELKCPICLEEYDNKSFVERLFSYPFNRIDREKDEIVFLIFSVVSLTLFLDAFCYVCIVQWSEVSNKCPLCKASFKSLIYDVESDSDYKTVSGHVLCTLNHTHYNYYYY